MELYLLDLLLVFLVIIYTFIASIFDIKTREVPDFLNYSLIVIALSLRLIFSIISNDFSFFLFGILGFLVFFLVANLMYYSKQWGGGDAKLLMGLGAALPFYPQSLLQYLNPSISKIPFMLILFLNLIVIGAVYAFFYSVILAIKNKQKIKKEFSHLINSKKVNTIRKVVIFGSLIILVYAIVQQDNLLRFLLAICTASIIFLFYLTIFLKAAEKARDSALEKINQNIKIRDIGAEIERICKTFNVQPIHNLSGHSIEVYNLHAGITIPNFDNNQESTIKPGVYAIEPFTTLSSASGSVRDGKLSGIYHLEKIGSVRDNFAREVLSFIAEEYNTLPFCSRWIHKKFGTRGLLALRQIEQAGLLHHYPQLIEKSNSKVAQAEHTLILTLKEKIITTL
jgi:Flp pilus assembly protein protease CpaA